MNAFRPLIVDGCRPEGQKARRRRRTRSLDFNFDAHSDSHHISRVLIRHSQSVIYSLELIYGSKTKQTTLAKCTHYKCQQHAKQLAQERQERRQGELRRRIIRASSKPLEGNCAKYAHKNVPPALRHSPIHHLPRNLKTCQRLRRTRTTARDILQTNNKNPILHLITRSVKQKEGTEKSFGNGCRVVAQRTTRRSFEHQLPLPLRPSIQQPLAGRSGIRNSRLKVTEVFCLIYCIFYAEMRKNFSPPPEN